MQPVLRKLQLLCRLNRPCLGLSQKKVRQKSCARVMKSKGFIGLQNSTEKNRPLCVICLSNRIDILKNYILDIINIITFSTKNEKVVLILFGWYNDGAVVLQH